GGAPLARSGELVRGSRGADEVRDAAACPREGGRTTFFEQLPDVFPDALLVIVPGHAITRARRRRPPARRRRRTPRGGSPRRPRPASPRRRGRAGARWRAPLGRRALPEGRSLRTAACRGHDPGPFVRRNRGTSPGGRAGPPPRTRSARAPQPCRT